MKYYYRLAFDTVWFCRQVQTLGSHVRSNFRGYQIKIEASHLSENLAPVCKTTRRHVPEVRTRLSFYFNTLP